MFYSQVVAAAGAAGAAVPNSPVAAGAAGVGAAPKRPPDAGAAAVVVAGAGIEITDQYNHGTIMDLSSILKM